MSVSVSLLVAAFVLAMSCQFAISQVLNVKSPDGQLSAEVRIADGVARYSVKRGGEVVLRESKLGLICDGDDFSKNLKLLGQDGPQPVRDDYEVLTAKRRNISYRGNRHVFHVESAGGRKLDIVFQVSNDGVAFRYAFPEASLVPTKVTQEITSFAFAPEAQAWLQPMSVAKTGWEKSNPSYEEHYAKGIAVGTPSTLGAGWVFPGLFRTGSTWVVISETGLGRGYCASRLAHEAPDGEYSIGFPDPRETIGTADVKPEFTAPYATPWRVIVVGDLATVAESTLGIDLADPAKYDRAAWIRPGRAAWSWVLLGDSQTTYDVQKQFIDYAAAMNWEYCLVDSMWDKQIGYEKIKELCDHAKSKNVGVLLWYNSAGDWNTTPLTPRNLMLTHEGRLAEFKKIAALGVKGVKVDFFGGDGRAVIDYYQDILDDAYTAGLLVNFHGSTIPRGWQRTYPHLMTMEGIKGFEFITFEQGNADQAPSHCAMLPFTRNVFDPMDFTPVCLDRIRNKVQRRTSAVFELALSVVFTSGVQHYAEIPDGMNKMPEPVKDFLKRVPGVWDDTRFVEGMPGKYVVLARRGAGRWYVAGINGDTQPHEITVDPAGVEGLSKVTVFADGSGDQLFEIKTVNLGPHTRLKLPVKPSGGFVAVFE